MQKPDGAIVVKVNDEINPPLTDYALSDALEWIQNLHSIIGRPRIVLVSEKFFNILSRHPMILEGISGYSPLGPIRDRDKRIIQTSTNSSWIQLTNTAIFFPIVGVTIINEQMVCDCREVIYCDD